MPRPTKEGMDYFAHDCGAAGDTKIEALRAMYGNDGYAFYFILLEQIYQQKEFELDLSTNREEAVMVLARKVGVSAEKFESMLTTALRWRCFDPDIYNSTGRLTSNGIKRRAVVVLEKRERMKERYNEFKKKVSATEMGAENSRNPAETQQKTAETQQAAPEKPRRKKPEETKVKYADFVSMTAAEYEKLVAEYGEADAGQMVKILNTYKGANGKTYKSDYHAILNWVVKRLQEEKSKGRRVIPLRQEDDAHANW